MPPAFAVGAGVTEIVADPVTVRLHARPEVYATLTRLYVAVEVRGPEGKVADPVPSTIIV